VPTIIPFGVDLLQKMEPVNEGFLGYSETRTTTINADPDGDYDE
jgi:hypothetical protein